MANRDRVIGVRAALRRLTTEIDGLDHRTADHFGVNRTDLRCLDVIRAMGSPTPSALAAAVGMTSGGLSLALDRLERAGYIVRKPNSDDRRSVTVEPTERLAAVEREIFGPLGRRMNRMLSRFDDDELAVIQDFLERAADAAASAAPLAPDRRSR